MTLNEAINKYENGVEQRQIAQWLKELKIFREGGPRGMWNKKDGLFECNQCGYEFGGDDTDDFRFCPWCGAKMMEVKADDNND